MSRSFDGRRARGALTATLIALGSLVFGVATGASSALRQTIPVAHVSATVNVKHVLGSRIARVKRGDGGVAVLLPTTMPLPTPDFTASTAKKGRYGLEIDGVEPCNEASVCLFALFTGQRGGKLHGRRVALSHGIRGAFADIQCGASCSPASIEWIEHGVLYTIEADPSVTRDGQQPVFVAAANQAIKAGPR
jgi:hypothetical protein